jgi:hypothetical protein
MKKIGTREYASFQSMGLMGKVVAEFYKMGRALNASLHCTSPRFIVAVMLIMKQFNSICCTQLPYQPTNEPKA